MMVSAQFQNILFGSLLTLLITFLVQYYRDKRSQLRTRQALKGEIKAARGRLDRMSDGFNETETKREQLEISLSSKMYNQHLPQLGGLSEKEIELIIEYYQSVEQIIESQNRYNTLIGRKYRNEGEPGEGVLRESDEKMFLKFNIEIAVKEAVDVREEVLPILDKRTSRGRWLLPSSKLL